MSWSTETYPVTRTLARIVFCVAAVMVCKECAEPETSFAIEMRRDCNVGVAPAKGGKK